MIRLARAFSPGDPCIKIKLGRLVCDDANGRPLIDGRESAGVSDRRELPRRRQLYNTNSEIELSLPKLSCSADATD